MPKIITLLSLTIGLFAFTASDSIIHLFSTPPEIKENTYIDVLNMPFDSLFTKNFSLEDIKNLNPQDGKLYIQEFLEFFNNSNSNTAEQFTDLKLEIEHYLNVKTENMRTLFNKKNTTNYDDSNCDDTKILKEQISTLIILYIFIHQSDLYRNSQKNSAYITEEVDAIRSFLGEYKRTNSYLFQ